MAALSRSHCFCSPSGFLQATGSQTALRQGASREHGERQSDSGVSSVGTAPQEGRLGAPRRPQLPRGGERRAPAVSRRWQEGGPQDRGSWLATSRPFQEAEFQLQQHLGGARASFLLQRKQALAAGGAAVPGVSEMPFQPVLSTPLPAGVASRYVGTKHAGVPFGELASA